MNAIYHGNDDPITAKCRSLQQEEYEVLESIYPECVSSEITGDSLKLEIPVELDSPRTISVVADGTLAALPENADRTANEKVLSLSALPPLLITVILPPSYPLHAPPVLGAIRAKHLWLPQVLRLQSILIGMWQPGEGVLYTWVEFIRTGEFLRDMGLTSTADCNTIRISHPAPQVITPLLTAHETFTKSTHFAQNIYPCSICLTSLKGSKCVQLSCSHIFCRSCLEDFWGLCIREGDVGRVGCPDPECVKAAREADVEEVARVVTEAEVQRWRWLREKRDLEKDPTVIHCPMAFCQSLVPKNYDGEEGSGWERLRSCPVCSFSFCALCRRTWHGPIASCPIAHSEQLVLEYLALPKGSSGREFIEKRFGKTNVVKLLAAHEDEKANREWLQSSTMACPGCRVHVEKSLGCNHMTCTKCRKHFCYRCGVELPGSDPYKHFSTTGLSCYNKLFDFQEEDEEWQPVEAFEA